MTPLSPHPISPQERRINDRQPNTQVFFTSRITAMGVRHGRNAYNPSTQEAETEGS
jgi:hypothetical protein